MTEVPPEFIIAADEEGGRCGQLIRANLLEAFECAEQGLTRQAQEQGCFTRARLNSCKQHHLPWTAKLRKESLDLLLDRILIVQAAARSSTTAGIYVDVGCVCASGIREHAADGAGARPTNAPRPQPEAGAPTPSARAGAAPPAR